MEEQEQYIKILLKQAKEFEKSNAGAEQVGKERVMEALQDKWLACKEEDRRLEGSCHLDQCGSANVWVSVIIELPTAIIVMTMMRNIGHSVSYTVIRTVKKDHGHWYLSFSSNFLDMRGKWPVID